MKQARIFLVLALAVLMCLAGCTAPLANPSTTASNPELFQPTTVPQTQPTTVPQTQPTTVPPTQPTTVPQPTLPGPSNLAQGYKLGYRMPNFTVKTYDGRTLNLYEVLQEKEMVLINIWASWCGPCQYEFPHMQDAYEMYSDKIEIFALSCEPEDGPEVLANYADKMELTFPMGRDSKNLLGKFGRNSIPTSIVIDRFGVICFIASGSIPDVESFQRLFDVFLGEDYTESKLLLFIPQAPSEE